MRRGDEKQDVAAKLRRVKRSRRHLHLERWKAFRSGEQGRVHRLAEGKSGREHSRLFTKRGQNRSRCESCGWWRRARRHSRGSAWRTYQRYGSTKALETFDTGKKTPPTGHAARRSDLSVVKRSCPRCYPAIRFAGSSGEISRGTGARLEMVLGSSCRYAVSWSWERAHSRERVRDRMT